MSIFLQVYMSTMYMPHLMEVDREPSETGVMDGCELVGILLVRGVCLYNSK